MAKRTVGGYTLNSGRYAYGPGQLNVPKGFEKFMPDRPNISFTDKKDVPSRKAAAAKMAKDNAARAKSIISAAKGPSVASRVAGAAVRAAGPVGALVSSTRPAGAGSDKPSGQTMRGNTKPSGTSTAWGGKSAPRGGPSGPPRGGPSGGPSGAGKMGSSSSQKGATASKTSGGGMKSGPGSTGGSKTASKSTSTGGMKSGPGSTGGSKTAGSTKSSTPAGSKSFGGPR